jgi:hypothetical protein
MRTLRDDLAILSAIALMNRRRPGFPPGAARQIKSAKIRGERHRLEMI